MLSEAITYQESPEDEEFLSQFDASQDSMYYLGSGDFGTAYSLGNGKVLKITSSKSEYDIAGKLLEKPLPNLATIYARKPTKYGFLIVMEELDIDDDVENYWYDVEEILSTQGLPIQYIGNFDEDEYVTENGDINPTSKKLMDELYGIVYDYRRLGIEASDIKADNIGRSKDGTLKAFDIEDRLADH